MRKIMERRRTVNTVLACLLSVALPVVAADEKPATGDSSESRTTNAAPASSSTEIELLKKMLIDQQKQIDELRRALLDKNADKNSDQSKGQVAATAVSKPEETVATPAVHQSLGEVASTTPIIPPGIAPVPKMAPPMPIAPPPAPQAQEQATAPLQFKIGDAYVTPVGFMDMTSVTRSTNTTNGIGTNFGGIPYANTQTGSLTENFLSIQNSRIGARVDAIYHNWKILGYWESDFLGQLGNPPNGGLAVSSNPFVFRMRLYWVDVRKGAFEFLAGQSWSLMTPNRVGISPLPGDIFYSQNIDVNYQAGLVWGRIPGFRFGFHPNNKAAIAFALENSQPYAGGGNGGSVIIAPTAIAGILGTQVNNGSSVISAPALFPDMIAKVALDPTRRFHIEFNGVGIINKISNPASTPAFQSNTKFGGGAAINLNFAIAPTFRIVTNNFWSDGGGRYIFGQAPDFIIRPSGQISLVHSGSTVSGFEWTAGKTLVYAYYGGVYIGKNLARDANGTTLIGYGPISSDGQNRAIQEITFGTNTTLMRDPKWGALNLMFQYSYLQRNPWLAAVGAPTNAHADMGFVNFRYTLPGAPPTLEK